jgi:thiol-disulfide isomerase/thioredoxin
MKKFVALFFAALLPGLVLFAQPPASPAGGQYQVLVERPNEKSLKGIISKEVLLNDTSFKWYAENLKGYTPNKSAVEGLKKHADSVQLLVFMGTWCEDSHNVIPKFFTLLDVAGFSNEKVTLIGVDRNKQTLSHLTEALGIKNVPTIMVMKNGKEAGRVVEFGKYGLFDMELGEILRDLR